MHHRYALFIALCMLAACTHQPQLQPLVVPPPVTCDSVNVTYAADIQPLLNNNCYSCHSTAATQKQGLDLEDTTSIRSYLQYSFHADVIYGSKLYHCMLHTIGVLPMPPDYIVNDCGMAMMRRWLSLGAPM